MPKAQRRNMFGASPWEKNMPDLGSRLSKPGTITCAVYGFYGFRVTDAHYDNYHSAKHLARRLKELPSLETVHLYLYGKENDPTFTLEILRRMHDACDLKNVTIVLDDTLQVLDYEGEKITLHQLWERKKTPSRTQRILTQVHELARECPGIQITLDNVERKIDYKGDKITLHELWEKMNL